MTTSELESGALRWGAAAVAALAIAAALMGGTPAALGVAGGGAIGLLNFRWLCRDAMKLTQALTTGGVARWRVAPALLRQLATLSALGALLLSELAHPGGVALGLAVLPPTLLIHGLRQGPDGPAGDEASAR
jgi:hypothetical protein